MASTKQNSLVNLGMAAAGEGEGGERRKEQRKEWGQRDLYAARAFGEGGSPMCFLALFMRGACTRGHL